MGRDDFRSDDRRMGAEGGGILVYIFIGIILFAALAYAFSKGVSSGGTNVGDKTAKLVATEILRDVQVLRDSVQEALAKGCSETEISFENDTVAGYAFATRDPCKIFLNPARSMKWASLPSAAVDLSIGTPEAAQYHFTMWYFVKSYPGGAPFGTTTNDIAVVTNVTQPVCEQINLLVAGERTIPTIAYAGGTFAATAAAKKYTGTGSLSSAVPASDTIFGNICVKGTGAPSGFGFLYSLVDR